MANPISMAILNLLAGAGGGYNQATSKGREEELGLYDRLISQQEAQKGREFQTSERKAGQEYGTSERKAGQEYNTSERVGRQGFEAGQAQLGRDFQHQERIGGEQFQSGENKLNRSTQMGIAGLEASTAIKTAKIREGIDETDPLSQARQAGIKAYLMALEHPETLMRGETPELKMLQAYNITKQMLKEQGVFGPLISNDTGISEPVPGITPGAFSPLRPSFASPYNVLGSAFRGLGPYTDYGPPRGILDLLTHPNVRTEP